MESIACGLHKLPHPRSWSRYLAQLVYLVRLFSIRHFNLASLPNRITTALPYFTHEKHAIELKHSTSAEAYIHERRRLRLELVSNGGVKNPLGT